MKIVLAQINPTVGDLEGNTRKILEGLHHARMKQADLVVFPELALTGYPPEDLLLLPHFIDAVERHLHEIIQASTGMTAIVGTPRRNIEKTEKPLYNSAAVIQHGVLLGFQDKMLLPTYDVFSERRYFEPAPATRVWTILGQRIGITICEDLWQHSELVPMTSYRRDPILELTPHYPDIVINLSASPYSLDKTKKRIHVGAKAAKSLNCPVLLCNQVGGNDSLIFDGYSFYVDAKGDLVQHAKGFEEDFLLVDLSQKPIQEQLHIDPLADLYRALTLGLRDYFQKSGFKKACFGLSGGIDSALVACLAVEALGKENVLGIGMPSRYSSPGSVSDSIELANRLGIQYLEIPIESPFISYLELLEPHFEGKEADTTEENLQARIRGIILMAMSNKLGYIVLSTGNKSELALGYSTLYGDMCGGLAIISDLTKMQVYALSRWINRDREIIPINILTKVPSAELKANQKDSDTLPDYAIIDHVLEDYVEDHRSPEEIAQRHGYPLALVQDLVKRIHRNEYKRRQSPPGLRVTEKAFSVGRRFPIVERFT